MRTDIGIWLGSHEPEAAITEKQLSVIPKFIAYIVLRIATSRVEESVLQSSSWALLEEIGLWSMAQLPRQTSSY
jgi:hypothetical protein